MTNPIQRTRRPPRNRSSRSPAPVPNSYASRNTDEAAAAVRTCVIVWRRWVTVPLIGDFHFNGHKLLREHPACAEALAKYRINPGNVGRGSKRDPQFAEMIDGLPP